MARGYPFADDFTEIQILRANSHMLSGQYADALAIYEDLPPDATDTPQILLNRAVVVMNEGFQADDPHNLR
jgi:hypothetical protein